MWTDDVDAHAFLRDGFPGVDWRVVTDRDAYDAAIGGADVVYLGRRHDRSFVPDGGRLRWVHLAATGVDQLGPLEALPGGVVLTNTRGMNTGMMADYAMGMCLALTWDLPALLDRQRARRWEGTRRTPRAAGKTLLLLGLGDVGRAVATRASASGLRCIAVRRSARPHPQVERVFSPADLHEALATADYIVCTLPATPETRRILDRRAFAAMRASAYLVNVGRGSVIDEDALAAALRSGALAGAALDVVTREPLPPDSDLWSVPNLILTPHVSGFSADYRVRAAEAFADNLGRFLAGAPLANVVDPRRGY